MELTEMEKNYLLDTNILFAIYTENDRLNARAREIIGEISKNKNIKLLLHPLVLVETLSLLKYRSGIEGEKMVRKELFDPKKYLILEETIGLDTRTIKTFEKEPEIGIIDTILIQYCLDKKIELVTLDREMENVWKKLQKTNYTSHK